MKIGILQTGHATTQMQDSIGDYDAMFHKFLGDFDFEFITFNVVDMQFPKSTSDADAWLITGSKHGAYEDHPFIPPLEAFIRDIHAAEQPLIGICFGHQIIAQALGGKVVKFDGGWSVGRQEYILNGEKVALNAWHQDQVVELPKEAQVIGSSAFCENAILAYGSKILTFQPHPEFESQAIDLLIKNRGRGLVPDALLDEADRALTAPNDNPLIAQKIAQIIKQEPRS